MRLPFPSAPILALFLCAPSVLGGCGNEDSENTGQACGERCTRVPRGGRATLFARTTYDDYQAATMSFEHATSTDEGQVRNDWDLLFGNDRDPDSDLFSVNTVVDDRSFIVDFGAATFCDIPERVDPSGFEVGLYGDHDDIPVVRGHVYLVRTRDSETDLYAAFLVIDHRLNEQVTVQWYRSPEPGRFVKPAACE